MKSRKSGTDENRSSKLTILIVGVLLVLLVAFVGFVLYRAIFNGAESSHNTFLDNGRTIQFLATMFALVIFLGLIVGTITYKLHIARQWRSIAEDKGYEGEELKRLYKLALYRPKDASRMITALPDKTGRKNKKRSDKRSSN